MVSKSLLLRVPSSMSILGAVLVIFTYVKFPKLRGYKHVELALYITVNDLVASIGQLMGDVPNGSAACWFQGMSCVYNFLSANLWTLVTAVQLYFIVERGRGIKDLCLCHVICWIFPLVVTLLPLSTNSYGKVSKSDAWCFITGSDSNSSSTLLWQLFGFYFWIWVGIILNFCIYISICLRLYRSIALSRKVLKSIRRLALYPIVFVLCWTASTAFDLHEAINGPSKEMSAFFYVAAVAPPLEGFLTAVIFLQNDVVKSYWRQWLRGYKPLQIDCENSLRSNASLRMNKDLEIALMGGNGQDFGDEDDSDDDDDDEDQVEEEDTLFIFENINSNSKSSNFGSLTSSEFGGGEG